MSRDGLNMPDTIRNATYATAKHYGWSWNKAEDHVKAVFSMDLMLRPKKARSSALDSNEMRDVLEGLDEDLVDH